MANYHYAARTSAGKEVTGIMQAESEAAVLRTLDEKALFPIRVEPAAPPRAPLTLGARIKLREVAGLYRQLGDLLRAGVPMLRALETLHRALPAGALRQEVERVRAEVADGRPLAEAFAEKPAVFQPAHTAMVRAGERGGFLEDVLTNLAEFVERQEELQSKVRGAMIYPVLLISALVVVTVVALVWLVPEFAGFLEDAAKPLPTRLLFGASDLVRGQWPFLLLGAVLAAAALGTASRNETAQRLWDRARLRLPLFGQAVRMVAITRFCRVLGLMLSSGVPILEALEISRDATGSRLMGETIGAAAENVRGGEPLAEPLGRSRLFPAEIVEMIAVAEESNTMDSVLARIADTVERRTNRQVDLAVRLIEPMVLVLMAGAVAFAALALYYPIFTMVRTLK